MFENVEHIFVKIYRAVDGSENSNEDNNSLRPKFSNGDLEGSIRSDPSEVSSISHLLTVKNKPNSYSWQFHLFPQEWVSLGYVISLVHG